jgi:prepilin peptidase CpaA
MDLNIIILMTIAMTIALVEDLRRMKIPNYVIFPTMLVALGYHTLTSGLSGLLFSAGGLALGLGLFILPYALGGMGAGDVKLMAALGAIVGPRGILIASILTILAGGVYGLILFALHPRYTAGFLKRMWMTFKFLLFNRQLYLAPPEANRKMPVLRYAVPIALGAGGYLIMTITGYDLFPELLGDRFNIFSIATH